MPRYHFNIRDDNELIEDCDGSVLLNLEEAREEALASAREMLAQKVRCGQPLNNATFEITDGAGKVLASVPMRDALKLF